MELATRRQTNGNWSSSLAFSVGLNESLTIRFQQRGEAVACKWAKEVAFVEEMRLARILGIGMHEKSKGSKARDIDIHPQTQHSEAEAGELSTAREKPWDVIS